MKDMSTQVCESDIPSQISVTTKTNPVPFQVKQTSTSPGSSSTSGESVATTSAEPVAADIPQSKRRNSSPKNKAKQNSDRLPKGAKDPVPLHNKFGTLEEMECTTSHSSSRTRSLSPKKNRKGRISPITHKKS